jgi:nitroimidazol reductase NimA-like FMN-containing flavoprotein (pyridoxamine 5'-phosphate oxidase superfamily)
MKATSVDVEMLPRAESLRLLRSVPYGRIVFTNHALPAVQPVNFVLDGDQIVIRTSSESKLVAAGKVRAVLAFEVDDIDVTSRAGWSVVVVGHARVVDAPAETARLGALRLESWAAPTSRRYICISMEQVTGRWLHSPV